MGAEFVTGLLTFVVAIAMFFVGKYAERKSVNMAVLAEVQRLLSVLNGHKKFREASAISGRDVPLIPFSIDVYKSQIANVGLIGKDIVADIVRFYGYIEFLNTLQSMRDEYGLRDDFKGFDRTYDSTLKTVVDTFSSSFNHVFVKYGIK